MIEWEDSKNSGQPCNMVMTVAVIEDGTPAILIRFIERETDAPVAYCLCGVNRFFENCSSLAELYNSFIGVDDETRPN